MAAGGALAVGCLALVPAVSQAAWGGSSGDGANAEQSQFADAASEFHVPEAVLMAVAYQESAWEAHPGQYNTSGGYGPMNLTDVTSRMLDGGEVGAAGRHDLSPLLSSPSLHTLTTAARLTGASADQLRQDTAQNIRGGAALLASYEKRLTGSTPSDPAAWYGAVARYSQASDRKSAGLFADRVFSTLKSGASRTTQQDAKLRLDALPSLKPLIDQLAKLGLKAGDSGGAECPPDVDCSVLAANAADLQVANRPSDGVAIRYIVLHDTESSYDAAIKTFQQPGGDAAQYVMRSSDGAVTQMVPNEDIAFHAGNYWFNMHSIGIEHEGFAAQGATWYSQTQYEATADLVRYLALRYGIPLDRQHIIGHDDVPGPADSYVAGMHWDPGPYWDWNRFMELVGAPTDAGPHGVGPVGTAVTISPDFPANSQTVKVCPADDPSGNTPACTERTENANFLPVRTAPSADAPLFGDQAVHPKGGSGTDEISDWGSTVQAGQQFVVAGRSGDWTAIWFSGAKVWFYNPGGGNTTLSLGARVLHTTGGPAQLYGSGYPQADEYPAGLKASTQSPYTVYSFPAGQAYVATRAAVPADDFFTDGDKHVSGSERYYTIQFNHRLALVNSAAVTAG
ncbi:N-acetylmuramoyl-L-alanine amidase [Phaeacidiphilus oryzae]|uniref:N-acetylmuramoyl-L-alanine amidase n=1 Tax=Phaeacidiphilus oryzae TaxID=348818 RepID=UPI0009FCB714|nr:N-acetylmuramoyl-L-alanine amidase [Phaeacidiphilus oryzae]